MPRGTPLSTLLTMLKAELGYEVTAGVATGDDAMLKLKLAHQQLALKPAFGGQLFRYRYSTTFAANTRYGVMPAVDTGDAFSLVTKRDGLWRPVDFGIDEVEEFNAYDSDVPETSDWVHQWQFAPGYETPATITVPSGSAIGTVASSASGNLSAGTYKWKLSYVTPAGELFGPTTEYIASTAMSGKKAVLSNIAVESQNLVSARRIYRTAANGATFYLVGTLLDNVTTTFIDNTADSALSVALGTSIPSNTVFQRYEVWPVPSIAVTLRFVGTRPLFPLVNDTDQCDLDDLLIVLFCAAGVLVKRKDASAPLVLAAARDRFNLLKAALPTKKPVSSLIGGDDIRFKTVGVRTLAVAGGSITADNDIITVDNG